MRKIFLMLQLLLLLVACAPATKDAYLSDYKAFIERVGEERDGYSDAKWEAVKVEYNRYSDEWYKKFESEV